MNLNQLYYFRMLARYEHYTRAAEELHITQPSLSKAIAGLEEELGVFLFEKSGRNVELTKPGRRYLDYVEAALDKLDQGREYLRKESMMTEGYIDLGMVTSVEYDRVPEWISSFRSVSQKNVFFSCKNGTSGELAEGLKNDRFDLIFCTVLPGESMIEFVPLFEQPLVLVAPRNHRLAARRSVAVRELEGERLVSHTRESAIWDITGQIYRAAGIRVNIVSEAEEDHTILGLVRAGLGCAVMTESPGIRGGDVVVVPLTETGFHRYICMGYRKDKARPQLAELFRRHVLNQREVRPGENGAGLEDDDTKNGKKTGGEIE